MIIEEKTQVENRLVEFWGGLFKTQVGCDKEILKKFLKNLTKISKGTKELLDRELTLEELTESLNSMPDGKSPGEDGITAKFYKVFWDKIKDKFLEYTIALKKQKSLKKNVGILRLIPKPKKDLLNEASWRPICLQGVDMKIFTKAIANRIKIAIEEIIHQDQIGFRSGQYIGQTIQLIQDIMQETKEKNLDAYLLSLDIEKAFDSVEWEYLDLVMEEMGMGGYTHDWIKLARSDMTIKINNNGWVTKEFSVTRGLKQGDPISPYLFLISIEPLAQKIRDDNRIEAITIQGQICKLSQYADDTTLYCVGKYSIQSIVTTLEDFHKISGYKNIG